MFAWLGLLPRAERPLASLKKISYFLARRAVTGLRRRRRRRHVAVVAAMEERGDVGRRREDEDEAEDPSRHGAFTTFPFCAAKCVSCRALS